MLAMDAADRPLMTLDEALAALEEVLPVPATPGIHADRDDPALDLSSMDGLAVRAEDGRRLRRFAGTCFAGQDPSGLRVDPGTGVRIMTGAALPAGADAVVPVEDLEETDGGWIPRASPVPGAFVRRRGEQASAGTLLRQAGAPLTGPWIGLAAQVGRSFPELRRLKVGIASTGDELCSAPAPWQIRDANGPMLRALVHFLGADPVPLPPLPDDSDALAAFFRGHGDLEVVLTSGGVSLGEKDHVPRVLARLGARQLFHRIRLKPGKPTLAALLGRQVLLCLPGNPVSAYLNARIFLPTVLARLAGQPVPRLWHSGALAESVANAGDRPLLHPCTVHQGLLHPLESRGSADLVRLANAQACVWVPEGGLPAGPARYLEIL